MCACAPPAGDPLSNCVTSALPLRHHGAHRFGVGAGGRISGQRVRHLSHQESEVPADPAHAADGPAWRHLEATGISGLRPQQGGHFFFLPL